MGFIRQYLKRFANVTKKTVREKEIVLTWILYRFLYVLAKIAYAIISNKVHDLEVIFNETSSLDIHLIIK